MSMNWIQKQELKKSINELKEFTTLSNQFKRLWKNDWVFRKNIILVSIWISVLFITFIFALFWIIPW